MAQYESSYGSAMLRKLEAMDYELSGSMSYTGSSRWMIPYADLLTLLLGFFLVLSATTQKDHHSLQTYTEKIQTTLVQKSQTLEAKESEVHQLQEKLQALTKKPFNSEDPDKSYQENKETQALDSAFDEMLATHDGIHVSHQERGLVISLMEGVLFAPGSSELTSSAQQTLDRLAQILKGFSRPIRVEGHTDNTPITTSLYPSNWELSTARATRIVRYLASKHHFMPNELSAVGYGEFHPISDNSTIEGKQKNRRVDIVILNSQTGQQETNAYSSPKPEKELNP